jgi:hypothetical protein
MDPRFLIPSPSQHELMLLLTIHRRGAIPMPVNPQELPPAALQHVPLSRLIDDGLVTIAEGSGGRAMTLTLDGHAHLRRLVIDYHLELMDLRRASNDFVAERVRMLERLGCARVLLYGASDTARVLLEVLKDSPIQVVAVLDDDPAKQGSTIGGVPVVSPARSPEYEFDSVVVTTVAFQDAILREKRAVLPAGKQLVGLFDDFLA